MATNFDILADGGSAAGSNFVTGTVVSNSDIATNGFFMNSNTVSQSYTVPPATNALSAGPVTVNAGVTVTILDGCRWVVV